MAYLFGPGKITSRAATPAFPATAEWRRRCQRARPDWQARCTQDATHRRPTADARAARGPPCSLIPYRDENQTQRRSYVTLAIVAINVLVWLVVQGAGSQQPLVSSVCSLGLVPGELTGALPPGTAVTLGEGIQCVTEPGRHLSHLITSMFLHGSWMHLIGNMWFLWLFGDNVEDSMTRPRFAAFYLLCGLAAAFAQVLASPSSGVPMVGASGAISGVMGAYLVLYPRVRVYVLVPIGFLLTSIALPAWAMLLYWIGIQVVSGLVSTEGGSGVAFWAHVGGFLAGAILVKPFAQRDRVTEHAAQQWRPRRVGWGER